MKSTESIKIMLEEAKNMEKEAEKSCDLILKEMEVNGFKDQIKSIRNDEREHQLIVEELISLLK